MAAKKWSNYISKAVYCIDNIHFSTKIDELKDFITHKLSVKVISLFEVKPRRSAWQNSNYHADHSTFRLCIPEDDNHKLLQPDVWPKILWYQPGSELRRRPRLRRISINRQTRMQRTWKTMFLPRSIGTLLFDIPAPPHLQLYYRRRLFPCLSRQEWMYFTPAHPGCHRQWLYLQIQWSHRCRGLRRGFFHRCDASTVSGDKIDQLSVYTAVNSDYQTNMNLDLDNTVAVLPPQRLTVLISRKKLQPLWSIVLMF